MSICKILQMIKDRGLMAEGTEIWDLTTRALNKARIGSGEELKYQRRRRR